MARNVSDLGLMLDAMAVSSIHDPLSRISKAGGFQAAILESRSPKHVSFSTNLGLRSIDPEVGEICKSAANKFALMGCTVSDDIPDFSGSIESFQVLRALLFADVRGELLPKERGRINPDIVWNIEKGLNLSVSEIIQARRTRHDLFHRVARFFDNHDLLICPTVAISAFPIEQRFPTEINGEVLTSYIDWMYLTFVITLVGCPAISIPCGLNKEGLPVGLQLIGRPHGDAQLLSYAKLLEQAIAFDASPAFVQNF